MTIKQFSELKSQVSKLTIDLSIEKVQELGKAVDLVYQNRNNPKFKNSISRLNLSTPQVIELRNFLDSIVKNRWQLAAEVINDILTEELN